MGLGLGLGLGLGDLLKVGACSRLAPDSTSHSMHVMSPEAVLVRVGVRVGVRVRVKVER